MICRKKLFKFQKYHFLYDAFTTDGRVKCLSIVFCFLRALVKIDVCKNRIFCVSKNRHQQNQRHRKNWFSQTQLQSLLKSLCNCSYLTITFVLNLIRFFCSHLLPQTFFFLFHYVWLSSDGYLYYTVLYEYISHQRRRFHTKNSDVPHFSSEVKQ